mgnify:CR=1 FL=1
MSLLFASPSLPETSEHWIILIALGLLCGAFPFVAQPAAQRFTSPEHTALILSLEPVFGVCSA